MYIREMKQFDIDIFTSIYMISIQVIDTGYRYRGWCRRRKQSFIFAQKGQEKDSADDASDDNIAG